MSRQLFCHKLQKQAQGLDFPPYPGALGQRIFNEISQEAWGLWQQHQTTLINEYRLNMLDAQSRQFLAKEMEKFLFDGGSAKPAGYVAPENQES